MRASKENCRQAIIYLHNCFSGGSKIEFIEQFLQAAEKRLPREETITRYRARHRKANRARRRARSTPLFTDPLGDFQQTPLKGGKA